MTDNGVIKFVVPNFELTYKKGQLLLPDSFLLEYGSEIPEKVYLCLPTGDVWPGHYCKNLKSICGVDDMMSFYGVKPYHICYVEYNGTGNLYLEIFNTCAVEINYARQTLETKKRKITGSSSSTHNYFTDSEIYKLSGSLCYSAVYNSCASYELLISKDHLRMGDFFPVLTKNMGYKLGLDESMDWLELKLRKFKWKIGLTWSNGMVLFNKTWSNFVRTMQINEGDICVLQYTSHYQKFEVAVLERQMLKDVNEAENQHGKSLMKFLKIMDEERNQPFNLVLPKLFSGKYGSELNNKVTFLVSDWEKYDVMYCTDTNVVYGLEDFVKTYRLKENYFLLFDYVGHSKFYVTIFDWSCMEICNDVNNRLLLENAVESVQEERDGETQLLLNNNVEGFVGMDGDTTITTEGQHNEEVIAGEANVENIFSETEVFQGSPVSSSHREGRFEITVKDFHMKEYNYGVDVKSEFYNISRMWKEKDCITVADDQKSWKLEIRKRRNSNRTTINQGWVQLRKDLNLKKGDICSFVSCSEDYRKFKVHVQGNK